MTFTYTASGKRATMTDAFGTSTYSYGGNDQLQRKSSPLGTLGYAYDLAGNLTNGNADGYFYDALNRLSAAIWRPGNGDQSVIYGYDAVGNLTSVTYSNGVVHNYSYDAKNRLTNLGVTNGGATPTPIAGYAYTVDAAGHRTSVTELSGHTVNYSYDNLYRLASETIAADPASMNGAVSYSYDAVGNRTQKVSTLPGYPGGLLNYNANDQLSTDTYDNDGNTVGSGTNTGSNGYVYDFENHLLQQGGITYVYDGDGNRVYKTVAGVTTASLIDDLTPTGYPQVVREDFYNGTGPRELTHRYYYGLERLSEARDFFPGSRQYIYYVYDGHGSVRALTDQSGAVTDTYDYDAFGTLLHSTGTTYNNFLFAGEQFDPDLGLYYNRARYLNTSTGRFWTMDTDEGDDDEPTSLHKYLYSEADPVDNIDPSGNQIDAIGALGVSETLDSLPQLNVESILNLVNGGIDKVPLSGGSYHKWMKWIGEAERDIFNSDCACFLTAHGLDPVFVAGAMLLQVPYDGTKSKITEFSAGTYPNSMSARVAEGIDLLRKTVQQHFQRDQYVRAEAQAHGAFRTDVYFRPGDFDKITIEHEALHNLTGESDADLARQLGWNGSGAPSPFISQALRDNRCDKLTPKRKKKKG
jgi:RHS repeat-associated protein